MRFLRRMTGTNAKHQTSWRRKERMKLKGAKGNDIEDGGVKSSSREGVIRESRRTERYTQEKWRERKREIEGEITRGKRKSTERFQRHVGALWAHTIVRSCTLFSCSWKKNLNWCEWLARARRTCRLFADNRRWARSEGTRRRRDTLISHTDSETENFSRIEMYR